MKKAILFDVYGTLISTGGGSVAATARILKKNGSDIRPEVFYQAWKKLHKQNMQGTVFMPEREIFLRDLTALYERFSIDGDAENDVQMMLESLRDRRLFPEAGQALACLAKRYEIVIASNTDTQPLLQNFDYNHVRFAQVFTSEDLRVYKPDARFYRRVLERVQLTAEEAVYVGDSGAEDVQGPAQAGMTTVLVDRRRSGAHFGQDFTVSSLLELPALFERAAGEKRGGRNAAGNGWITKETR